MFPRLCRKDAAALGESFEGRQELYAVLVLLREDLVLFPEDVVSQGEVLRELFGDRRQRDADRREWVAVLRLFAKCLELQRKARR